MKVISLTVSNFLYSLFYIFVAESYQAAIRFITEKNNRDHSTTGNEPMVHATIINGNYSILLFCNYKL